MKRLLLDATARYLQDTGDHQVVLASRKHRSRTVTLDQVKQRLGLSG